MAMSSWLFTGPPLQCRRCHGPSWSTVVAAGRSRPSLRRGSRTEKPELSTAGERLPDIFIPLGPATSSRPPPFDLDASQRHRSSDAGPSPSSSGARQPEHARTASGRGRGAGTADAAGAADSVGVHGTAPGRHARGSPDARPPEEDTQHAQRGPPFAERMAERASPLPHQRDREDSSPGNHRTGAGLLRGAGRRFGGGSSLEAGAPAGRRQGGADGQQQQPERWASDGVDRAGGPGEGSRNRGRWGEAGRGGARGGGSHAGRGREKTDRQAEGGGRGAADLHERAARQEERVGVSLVRRGRGSTATFFTQDSFADVGASEEVIRALANLGITRPSYIQAAAYRALGGATSGHVVLADHAGSGKTLAYLLPLVQALRAEEAAHNDAMTLRNSPRVIVLAPTAELCSQVLSVARALARGAPFRSISLTGGFRWRTQRDSLDEGADLVVATPGRLAEHVKAGNLKLAQCRALVLDEADVLLGDAFAFAEQLAPLREAVPPSTRFVLVTATLAEPVFAQLQRDFPGIAAAFGPGLHRTAPGVLEQLVDCSGGDIIDEDSGFERKAAALERILKEQAAARTIVFCNKIETCRKVENLLNRGLGGASSGGGALVLAHHAAIDEAVRQRNLKAFLAPPLGDDQRMVLVCTDRASRGIDSAHVEHVVLFDFPRDPSEYVRRAGRVSRGAGGSGVVSILVLGRQVGLAKQLLDRNKKGLPIHKVPIA